MAILFHPYRLVRRLSVGLEPLHNSGHNRIGSDPPFTTTPRDALPRFPHFWSVIATSTRLQAVSRSSQAMRMDAATWSAASHALESSPPTQPISGHHR